MDPPPVAPLAAIRKRKLLSQRALARQAGVALSTIYLLEAGKTDHATFKVMRAVSDALGAAPESIAEFRRVIDAAPDPKPHRSPRHPYRWSGSGSDR
jgi:transcriptional regulator with XRE-family HTH domain